MNTTTNACHPHRRAMDAHFAAQARPDIAQAMFVHLANCAPCRRRYDRHLLLAELDPRAPSAEARLARGLGLRRPRRRWQWMTAASMTLAACVLFFWLPRGGSEFAARGGSAPASTLLIYRVHDHGVPARLPASAQAPAHLAHGDELSFAYANPEKYERLMVFAVDDHGHVYWFHPAWTDASTDPTAIAVAPAATVTELGEAVSHDFDGHALTVYGLFTHATPTVRQVEALIAKNGLDQPIGRVLRYRLELE